MNERTLIWFSCGAASAVAAKKTLERHPKDRVEVIYCDTLKYEHPDNVRFLKEIETWLQHPIKILKSEKYADIYEVFEKEKYLRGIHGAPCTRALKRNVRLDYQKPDDTHVFGLTVEEQKRIDQMEKDNPGLYFDWVLRELKITKNDCFKVLKGAGIALPEMYRLGYKNNNCIGCVKGGAGYWNKIRDDFPEAFERMASIERKLNFALLRLKKKRVYLDELPRGVGRYVSEPDIECGALCVAPNVVEYLDWLPDAETTTANTPQPHQQTP